MNWTVRLRLVQVAGIFLLLECFRLSRSLRHEWNGSITPIHWFIIVAAIWAGIAGFTLQRRIVNRPRKSSTVSTPFTRWRAGHMMRLAMANAVGLDGFCLSVFAGPPPAANALFALGLLLLVVWTPGPMPEPTEQG